MPVYTVHEPSLRAVETSTDPERLAFVRDGFSRPAFLFAPLWMLWHRMWLVLVGYLVLTAALMALVKALGASTSAAFLVGVLVSLLVGLEASTLRRFALSRRGWKNIGIVSGDDIEDAERRFFDAWLARPTPAPDPPPAAGPRMPPPPPRVPPPGVIGLFPEPGANR